MNSNDRLKELFKENKKLNKEISELNAVSKAAVRKHIDNILKYYQVPEVEKSKYALDNEECIDFHIKDLGIDINFRRFYYDEAYYTEKKEIYKERYTNLHNKMEQVLVNANKKLKGRLNGDII